MITTHRLIPTLRTHSSTLIAIGLFLLILLIGLFTYPDYGLSWDESHSRLNGIMSANFILEGDPALFTYIDRDYGVAFEVPLIALERIFKVADQPHLLYPLRHLATFLFFFTGLIGLYLITHSLTQSPLWSLLAVTCLSLSPRIWAHSFFNSKDIPFMVVYIWCLYWLLRYLQHQRLSHLILLSLLAGYLTGIRIVGIITIPLVSAILLINHLLHRPRLSRLLTHLILFSSLTLLSVYLFWPYLWPDPIHHFITAFSRMSQFPWTGSVFYLGQHLTIDQIPWHYLPIWITLTTPLLYLFGFILYHLLSLRHLTSPRQLAQNTPHLTLLLWFWAPVTAVYLLNSPIYDEYRQLFFIYPVLLIMSVLGLRSLFLILESLFRHRHSPTFSSHIPQLIFISLISLNHFLLITFMVTSHPYQHLYFNRLSGPNLTTALTRFDGDYWGLSYQHLFLRLLEIDPSPTLNVTVANTAGKFNLEALPPHHQSRLNLVELDHPDKTYYLTNYRWDPISLDYLTPVTTVQVHQASIAGLYRF